MPSYHTFPQAAFSSWQRKAKMAGTIVNKFMYVAAKISDRPPNANIRVEQGEIEFLTIVRNRLAPTHRPFITKIIKEHLQGDEYRPIGGKKNIQILLDLFRLYAPRDPDYPEACQALLEWMQSGYPNVSLSEVKYALDFFWCMHPLALAPELIAEQ